MRALTIFKLGWITGYAAGCLATMRALKKRERNKRAKKGEVAKTLKRWEAGREEDIRMGSPADHNTLGI